MPSFDDRQQTSSDLTLSRAGTVEESSISQLDALRFGESFLRPAYEHFCFSRLPGFFETVLLGKSEKGTFPPQVLDTLANFAQLRERTCPHVIFVFFDAFGWESFERFRDSSEFLKRVDRDGIVAKTTSQFPSTTATHVTTALSGLTACEHEVCGWDYYEPSIGRMIRPLKFSFSDEPEPNTLLKAGYTPRQFLPPSTLFPNLTSHDVMVRLHGPASFFPSTFNCAYAPEKSIVGYPSLDHGIASVIDHLRSRPTKSYQSLYIDAYDSTCHQHGVGAGVSDDVARDILDSLCGLLRDPSLPPTLLVVSADHGHIKDRHDGSIALQHVIPDIEGYLKRDNRDNPIRFSGGTRYLFLHPREECHEHLTALLREKFSGAATIMTIPELVDAGLVRAQDLTPSRIERLGTVGILPHAGHSVYWYEPPLFEYRDRSHHGGISFQEMETPLLLLPIGR